VGHALFDDVSRNIEDRMKRLFDPDNPHLAVWVWIYDPDCRVVELIPLRARRVRAHMPLHHAQPPEIAQATLNFWNSPHSLRRIIIPVSNVCLRVQNTRDVPLSFPCLVTQQNRYSSRMFCPLSRARPKKRCKTSPRPRFKMSLICLRCGGCTACTIKVYVRFLLPCS